MEITLRAPELSDLDSLYYWENDPEISRYGAATAPYSRAQLWEYINNYDADPFHAGQLRLMIDADDATIGCVDLYDIDAKNLRASIGIVIDAAYRRNGYAKVAIEKLHEYCINSLGLHQLSVIIPLTNLPSLGLFVAVGYTTIATLPQWVRLGKNFVDANLLTHIL